MNGTSVITPHSAQAAGCIWRGGRPPQHGRRPGGAVHLGGGFEDKEGEDAVADVAVLRLHRPRRASRRATAGAAGRLVLQPLGCVELLLAGGEDEAVATVLADDF